MSSKQSITTRRGFLKAAVVTAAAATVAGGGTAILSKELGLTTGVTEPLVAVGSAETIPAILPASAIAPAVQTSVTSSNAGQLVSDLAAATGDNARLASDLNAAREKIALLEQSLSEQASQHTTTQLELDKQTKQMGVLGGLVALYEQLDQVDIGDLVADGLSQVGASISGLIDDIPSVQDGLTASRAILNNLESEIPLVEGGRIWLLAHVAQIQLLFSAVMEMLESAVDRAEPLLDMMGNWAKKVLRWLPFGFGQRTALLIDAITALVNLAPDSVSGAESNIVRPLEVWLGKADEEDIPLVSKVVRPIRDEVLVSAENHLTKTHNLHTQYTNKVAQPLDLALAQRNRIRASIAAYREQNEI